MSSVTFSLLVLDFDTIKKRPLTQTFGGSNEMGGKLRKVDVSYQALEEELKKHGPEVRQELHAHLLEIRSLKNSSRSSSEEDSHKSFRETPA